MPGHPSRPSTQPPHTGRAHGLRKIVGIDRSGPLPIETGVSQPWRPWTIPNAIGYLRLALIAPLLIVAFSDDDGRSAAAVILAGAAGFGDYFDGLAARLTGQYSRLGALLDPLVDRVLALAGVAICFEFELLPRWALLALAGRELLVVALARVALSRGAEIEVNWLGRIAVWPTMLSMFVALMAATPLAEGLLYIGLLLGYAAVVRYLHTGYRELAGR